MNEESRPPQSDPAAAQTHLPARADIEATLCALLIRFRDSAPEEQHDVARFASAGADAILTEIQSPAWLSSAEGAAILGVTEEVVIERADKRELPAARDQKGKARIHRRDLGLYRMSRQLGATEGQWTQLVTPIAWSEELTAAGFNPWDETMPG